MTNIEDNRYAVATQQGTEMIPFNKDTESDEYSYAKLDSEQIKAIESPLPTVVCGAAATGKATAILHRIAKATADENIVLSNIFICSPHT